MTTARAIQSGIERGDMISDNTEFVMDVVIGNVLRRTLIIKEPMKDGLADHLLRLLLSHWNRRCLQDRFEKESRRPRSGSRRPRGTTVHLHQLQFPMNEWQLVQSARSFVQAASRYHVFLRKVFARAAKARC